MKKVWQTQNNERRIVVGKRGMHCYHQLLAIKYTLEAAIVLEHFYLWILTNEKKGINYKDGRFWTYQTLEEIHERIPELSIGKIRGAIRILEKNGIIVKGNYNKKGYDRTIWYAITDFGFAEIERSEQMDSIEFANGNVENGKPIPDKLNNLNNTSNVVVGVSNAEKGKNGNEEIVYLRELPVLHADITSLERLMEMVWNEHYPSGSRFTEFDKYKAMGYVMVQRELENGKLVAAFDYTRAELLMLAFDIAAEKDKCNWTYINGIYNNWEKDGIDSVDAYYQHEAARFRLKNHL